MNEQDTPSTGLSVTEKNVSGKATLKQDEAGSMLEALGSLRADHVFIGVFDFEGTIQWYKEKLGFREERRWTVDALPGMQLAYIELNGFRIEIIGSGGGQRAPVPSSFEQHLRMQGYQHLCFSTNDVDAVIAELNRRGVTTFVAAEDYPSGAERRVAFIQDNEGNVIEFAGPLKGTTPNSD
jgi:catechol 2,3-dioxygenase-like lactoylglutathione lyase family enzyme